MRCLFVHPRRGMSLVELLVVVAILGLLAVTVLPTVASTTESRRTREAARVTSSFIASAQTRALGRREWSGFRVVPAAAGSNMAFDFFLVDVPPPYRGESVPTEVQFPPPVAGLTTGTATITSGSISAEVANALIAGSPVRFGGHDPWYSLASINPGSSPTGSIGFTHRTTAGQAGTNTPWPPANQPLAFEIAATPVPYGTAVTLGEGRLVDIIWSGFYNAGAFTRFDPPGTVTVLYDGTGRLRRLMRPGMTAPTDAPGPILFLVGRADRAGQTYNAAAGGSDDSLGANWQYSDSFWVMINPATGTVHQAACEPGHDTPEESQFYIRSYLSAGAGS
jgi:prepilin-type N-terminal cleavage/methylation domain-containing protein